MKQKKIFMAQPELPVANEAKQKNSAIEANATRLNVALSLHQQGQLDQAESIYKEILQSQPQHFDALQLLAAIAAHRKNLLAAIELFDQALTIYPHHPIALNNRGNVLLDLKRTEQALESYDLALTIKPDFAEALNNRGCALFELKRHEQALDNYDLALTIKPDYVEAFNNRGNALHALNRLEQALESYQLALSIKPDYAEALNNCGNVLRDLQRHEQALDSYNRALAIKPDYAEAFNNCGNVLLDMKCYEQALDCYDQALVINPDYVEAFTNRGNALLELKHPEQALDCYDQALAIKPDYVEALNDRGIALMQLGRVDEAETSFRQALKINPDFIDGYSSLSAINKKATSGENMTALMAIEEAVLKGFKPPLSNKQAVQLYFALGQAHHNACDYEKAFPYFLKGCKRMRASCNYDPNLVARFFASIMEVYDHTAIDKLRGNGNLSPLPIFVLGMPRSGTTLTEQIISSHPQVHGGGELNDLSRITGFDAFQENLILPGQDQLNAWGAEYIDQLLRLAPDAHRITDKMPANFFAIGLIHLLFPNAKVIHVNRNPVDTCLSCFTTWFKYGNDHTYDLAELGRYYLDYTGLMAHWRKILPSNALLDVYYEDLVTDTETQSRRIIEYCELEWNDACLGFHKNKRQINTASIMQARQPIYHSSIARWRSYEKFLEPLLDVLGELSLDDYQNH